MKNLTSDDILSEIGNGKMIGRNEGVNRKIEIYELRDGRKVALKKRKTNQHSHNLLECGLSVLQLLAIGLTSSEKYLYFVPMSQTIPNERRRAELPVNSPDIHYVDNRILIEDWVQGEPLDERLKSCSTDDTKRLGVNIGKEVADVHKRGYVFGDLKASNIIVMPNGEIYHIDFERCRKISSKFLRDTDLATLVGSVYHLPPSVVRTFRNGVHSGYMSGGGKADDKTQTLENCCGLFIHRRYSLNVIQNVLDGTLAL